MPNGGTDNCMNCAHNRANQVSQNIKAAPSHARLSFCSVHQIPISDRAWTYCSNIRTNHPKATVPINTVGLLSEGYSRIPWLGRISPIREEQISRCEVCGSSSSDGLLVNSAALDIDLAFCSNDHYRDWHEKYLEIHGFDQSYIIGRNELHEAVLSRDSEKLTRLLDQEPLLNQADHYGWTALHLAAYLGFERGVELLVEAGAVTKLRDHVGRLPIELAGGEGFDALVGMLEASTYSQAEERELALLQAATDGNLQLVEVLIGANTSIECTDYRGRTPLLLAVSGNHYVTTVFLLDHGANIHVVDDYGNSPVTTVNTWNSRGPDDLYRLVHRWAEIARS